MTKIDNYLAFVKEQVAVQQRLARRYDETPVKRNRHLGTSRSFAELAEFLEEINSKGTQDTSYLHRSDSPKKRLQLTYEDIEGVSDEYLKEELKLSEADRQDILTEHLIARAGGILPLDKIMLQLLKRTGEGPKRNTLISRLYRMVEKGMIFNVPGKKGVYSTYEVTEDEAKKLFGADSDTDETSSAVTSATSAAATSDEVTQPRTGRLAAAMNTKYANSASTAAINRR